MPFGNRSHGNRKTLNMELLIEQNLQFPLPCLITGSELKLLFMVIRINTTCSWAKWWSTMRLFGNCQNDFQTIDLLGIGDSRHDLIWMAQWTDASSSYFDVDQGTEVHTQIHEGFFVAGVLKHIWWYGKRFYHNVNIYIIGSAHLLFASLQFSTLKTDNMNVYDVYACDLARFDLINWLEPAWIFLGRKVWCTMWLRAMFVDMAGNCPSEIWRFWWADDLGIVSSHVGLRQGRFWPTRDPCYMDIFPGSRTEPTSVRGEKSSSALRQHPPMAILGPYGNK